MPIDDDSDPELAAVAALKLRFVKAYRDRHGKLRVYFRPRSGPLKPMTSRPGSSIFRKEYDALLRERAGKPIPSLIAAKPQRATRAEFVYFIKSGARVKIGRSTDPEKRLADLQVGSHHQLALLFMLPGGADVERVLHLVFAPYHVRGEWFEAGSELMAFIERQRGTKRGRVGYFNSGLKETIG